MTLLTEIEGEKGAGGGWVSCKLILCIVSLWVVFFRLLSEKILMRFLFGVSCQQWLLTRFALCSILFSSFSKSHQFFYFFARISFNARKCCLCQTLACKDRRSHRQKLLLVWDNKLLQNDRYACIKHNFSKPETFGNIKRTSSVCLCWLQRFLTSLRDISPFFCSPQNSSWQNICGQIECCFENFAENVLREKVNILAQ